MQGNAAPRTFSQARDAAAQALAQRLGHDIQIAELPQHAALRGSAGVTDAEVLPYYMFADAERQNFVVVAGSDILPEVIGYGDGDVADELPATMQSWLEMVSDLEQWLEAHPAAALQFAQERAASRAAVSAVPPIMTCTWGQDSPYNSCCPLKDGYRSVVGCIATAVSQVLYTEKYPTTTTGSVTYYDCGTSRTVDFSSVSFDYSQMYDKYVKGISTQDQTNQVAQLCYNVGAACLMQYSAKSSSSIVEAAEAGMNKYFKCTAARVISRCYYGLDEWNDMLQAQLSAGHPFVYGGQSNSGGHAFVIDGRDAEGLYHVNWGWDGSSDGYYDITLLYTPATGTGASANNGFAWQQQALIGLGNPKDFKGQFFNTLHTYYTDATYDKIDCTPSAGIKKGSQLTFSTYAVNRSSQAESGTIGVVATKADGTTYNSEFGSSTTTAEGSKYAVNSKGVFSATFNGTGINATYTIPSDIPDGTYHLWTAIKEADGNQVDYIRQSHLSPSYWTLTVSGSSVKLSHEAYGVPVNVSNLNF